MGLIALHQIRSSISNIPLISIVFLMPIWCKAAVMGSCSLIKNPNFRNVVSLAGKNFHRVFDHFRSINYTNTALLESVDRSSKKASEFLQNSSTKNILCRYGITKSWLSLISVIASSSRWTMPIVWKRAFTMSIVTTCLANLLRRFDNDLKCSSLILYRGLLKMSRHTHCRQG